MIKVLHFVSTPAIWSGVMSVIMNYYRHMDRSRVQFDFLCFSRCSPEESYEGEIEELGGRVFFIGKPSPSVRSIRELQLFFKTHNGEYTWFHNHEVYLSFLLRPLPMVCRPLLRCAETWKSGSCSLPSRLSMRYCGRPRFLLQETS